MPSSIVGDVFDPCKQKFIEWEIKNYFLILQAADTCIESPNFHFLNSSWCLTIFPNGERYRSSVDNLSFYLTRKDNGVDEISVEFALGIKCGETSIQKSNSFCFTFDDIGYGWPVFIKRSELFSKRQLFGPNGTLKVFCRAKSTNGVVESECQTFIHGMDILARDFRNLLHDGHNSDAIIKVKNRQFLVHKLILGTRSSVFSAMFEHNMKEKNTGTVEIVDCKVDVFQEFLAFMYSGKVEKLSLENAPDLYSLADKYNVRDLKDLCLDYMKGNLSLDNVCNVVIVADQYNEVELKESAVELIRKNIKTIVQADQWISLMSEKPTLAIEIFMAALPGR